ncbi:MAG: MFS transporter [Oscillochloris sp.]|nr:MFS transporter [Oscillochloris sp.]
MPTESGAPAIITRYARRNFWLMVLDGSAFIFGVSMVSRFTVLPLVVERLTDARWAQGMITTLFYAGWLLPGLFTAPLVAAMERRKPWVLRATIFERLPYLALGLIFLFLPNLPNATLLAIVYVLYGIFAFGAGFTSIAWQDLVARLIPEKRWGTFFGLQSGLGGVFGVGAAAVAGLVLATMPFPQSVGVLALACFGAMIVSYIFLALCVEPAQPAQPAQPMSAFLRSIKPLLARDQRFRRYLISRAAIALGLTGHAFITAAALERFNPPAEQIGLFTGALLGAQALANLGLGALADRWGHKQVLELSTGLGLLALLLTLVAPSVIWFVPIFLLVGAAQAGYQLSGFTLVFAFSPPAERPTYIGVANIALAPVAAFGPLLAGWIAGFSGYNAIFAVLILFGIGGLSMLHWQVTAPPQAIEPAQG